MDDRILSDLDKETVSMVINEGFRDSNVGKYIDPKNLSFKFLTWDEKYGYNGVGAAFNDGRWSIHVSYKVSHTSVDVSYCIPSYRIPEGMKRGVYLPPIKDVSCLLIMRNIILPPYESFLPDDINKTAPSIIPVNKNEKTKDYQICADDYLADQLTGDFRGITDL